MGENKKINANQRKAINALIAGKSRAQAATAANVGETTIYRWLGLPEFNAELRQAENQAMREAQRLLVAKIEENLTILDEIKNNSEASDNARIRAIQLELDSMLEWRNVAILEERIQGLEDAVNEIIERKG